MGFEVSPQVADQFRAKSRKDLLRAKQLNGPVTTRFVEPRPSDSPMKGKPPTDAQLKYLKKIGPRITLTGDEDRYEVAQLIRKQKKLLARISKRSTGSIKHGAVLK